MIKKKEMIFSAFITDVIVVGVIENKRVMYSGGIVGEDDNERRGETRKSARTRAKGRAIEFWTRGRGRQFTARCFLCD